MTGPAIPARVLLIVAALLAIASPRLHACSVPVFRYALERWPADKYELTLFHRGALKPADEKVAKWLEGAISSKPNHINISMLRVDLSGAVEPDQRALWQAQPRPRLPWLALRYPLRTRAGLNAWAGPLNRDNAAKLLDSPVRREIVKRILDGDSAVWVLLECDDKARNNAAAKLLQSRLNAHTKTLALPDEDDNPGLPTPDQTIGPDVRVAFSMLRLSRKNPAEAILVNALLHSENDLAVTPLPLAFPIFGRGRALYALVGKGINPETIKEACAFLVGACSCQAKAENPGTDLPILADWQGSLRHRAVKDVELPPLAGLTEFRPPEVRIPAPSPVTSETPVSQAKPVREQTAPASHLARNIIVLLCFGLAIAAAATVVVLKRGGRAE